MRLLVVVVGVVLVASGAVAAKELKVTNSADFVNCAAGVALTGGPDVGQVALAGDTCVVQPGGYIGVVIVTVQNLKLLANIGASLNGRIVIQANGVQIGAAGQGFTINDTVGPAGIDIQAAQDVVIEENVVASTAGPAIRSSGAGDLRNVRLLNNQLRSTVANGLHFMHTGALEDLVIANSTLETNGGAGIVFGAPVNRARKLSLSNNRINSNTADGIIFINNSSVEELEIARNTIRGNTVGVQVSNGGGVSRVAFSGNTISANQFFNVLFANAGFLEDLSFEGDELGTTTMMGGAGVFMVNGGVAERLEFKNVLIERNRGHGLRVQNAGRLRELQFIGGRIRNNAGHNVFIQHSLGGTDFGVSHILFQDVVIEQADDNGVRILTNTAEIGPLIFKNVLLAKNGALGICVRTTTGTLGNISIENSTVRESQGGLGTTACDLAPQAAGSGVEILTLGNTPVSNISVRESLFTNNGGFGLRLQALGNDRVTNIAIQNSRFEQNGTRAALGQGSGVSIRGEIVQDITVNPTIANDNNDHGIEISAPRDILNVSITGGEFSNNDRNNDNVGSGISVSANEDVLNLAVAKVKLSENAHGLRVQADKLTNGQIAQSEILNNRQAGVQAVIPTLGELDATNNYWGSPSGPSAPNGCSGQADCTPFLSTLPGGPTPPTPPPPPPPPPGNFIACAAGTENKIDDIKILGIIDAWIKGQGYQTCGVPSDSDVLQALSRWISRG
ncbi:hypothetical protein LM602_03835 [Candidatus Acetothermia bacterium]|jgi:hypothetical protein|nr:hypothetical protein [Candidatus Acetothermia bacterium]MCI2436388.1 hypothetical protein [Candidatus Acetothermia bacterium]